MGIITKIEEQKNKNRVNIFIDDSFFCGLEKETALIFRLKTGKEVDIESLNQAIIQSEVKNAFNKSIDYLSIRNHSKKELKDKLLKKGFSKDVIESTLDKLEEYNYIDDEKYTKLFIEQNKRYSKLILLNKLLKKGIDREIIDKNLESLIDEDNEFNNCMIVAEKFLDDTSEMSIKDKQKIFAKLSRRGFKYDVIVKVFNTFDIDITFD